MGSTSGLPRSAPRACLAVLALALAGSRAAEAQKAVIAATEAQPRPAPVMASSQQSSAWDQSSLIGKIFIGVGTLLTLASAARMFMA